jgi:hypothetical protein
MMSSIGRGNSAAILASDDLKKYLDFFEFEAGTVRDIDGLL